VTASARTPLLGPGTRATGLVRLTLLAVALLVSVATDVQVVTTFPVGIDVVIPMAAADRWSSGETVYLATGFTDPSALPPFLYPPFVLPFVVPLTALPLDLVRLGWTLVALLVAVAVCRRLAIGWALIPIVLLWEPMLGSIWGANVQILLFAAFVAAFWRWPARHGLLPEPRDIDAPGAVTPLIGWYAATVASVKATQLQAWLAMARRGPKATLLGASPWVIVVIVTLPLVGFGLYVEWLGQLSRASDPSWPAMGPSLLKYLPSPIVIALTVASFGLALRLRGPDTGIWLGLTMLVLAPNMHDFQGLFLLPAMLRIRREFAILAALLTATATAEGWWLGIAIAVGTMLAGRRWAAAYEPSAASMT
jgi:Glycosyltransferase family 87